MELIPGMLACYCFVDVNDNRSSSTVGFTTEIPICNWSASLSTTTKLELENTCHELCLSTWSRVPWTLPDLARLDSCSDPITSFSVRVVLEITGRRVTIPKVRLSTHFICVFCLWIMHTFYGIFLQEYFEKWVETTSHANFSASLFT